MNSNEHRASNFHFLPWQINWRDTKMESITMQKNLCWAAHTFPALAQHIASLYCETKSLAFFPCMQQKANVGVLHVITAGDLCYCQFCHCSTWTHETCELAMCVLGCFFKCKKKNAKIIEIKVVNMCHYHAKEPKPRQIQFRS